jgi:hypothetical protein
VQESVAVAGEGGRVTLVGLIALQVSPAGNGVSDRLTVPANPFRLAMLRVEVAVWPVVTVTVEALGEMLKS